MDLDTEFTFVVGADYKLRVLQTVLETGEVTLNLAPDVPSALEWRRCANCRFQT